MRGTQDASAQPPKGPSGAVTPTGASKLGSRLKTSAAQQLRQLSGPTRDVPRGSMRFRPSPLTAEQATFHGALRKRAMGCRHPEQQCTRLIITAYVREL